jgi:4-alpha-glucanotransferase
MNLERSAGILLHITSLPGEEGAGTLGKEAYLFADFLHNSGQTYWQILPVNPVLSSRVFSPYDSPSSFAGNPLFISIMKCVEKGWVYKSELPPFPEIKDETKADFVSRETFVFDSINVIQSLFEVRASQSDKDAYRHFRECEAWWLDDYTLFTALAAHYQTFAWVSWPKEIAFRNPKALDEHRQLLKAECELYAFTQFIFAHQWHLLKEYCTHKNVKIIGDIPIYVSFDSADAWVHPELFLVDPETGLRKDVAGVPPDYFSPTGQLWGNPLYRWFDDNGKLSAPVVLWWIQRIKRAFTFADMVRIDHFRAFESFWAVPFGEQTAVNGKWLKGPGIELFNKIRNELGNLQLIAEDLGVITKEVEILRDSAGFPGMKIFQFAFDGSPDNPYLNHSIINSQSVVYTGTHDNDTSAGWYASIDEPHRRYVRSMLGIADDSQFASRFIECAYSTTSDLCIIPMQDIFGLDSSARMNTPSKMENNWSWRMPANMLLPEIEMRLKKIAHIYFRMKLDGETNSVSKYFNQ